MTELSSSSLSESEITILFFWLSLAFFLVGSCEISSVAVVKSTSIRVNRGLAAVTPFADLAKLVDFDEANVASVEVRLTVTGAAPLLLIDEAD